MMDSKILPALAVLLLVFSFTNADGHSSCFDDRDACTSGLKKLMVDDNAFWFGKEFAKRCSPGSFSVDCTNPDAGNFDILSRVYNTSTNDARLVAINNKLTLVDVWYPAKQGKYYGCGHSYQEPGTKFRLDPLKVTTINSWTLDHLPTITWESDGLDSTLNTIVVWDVGYYYTHGLYINARGGKFETATEIDAYHGPINPRPRPNVFLFAVFKQSGFIDPGMVSGTVGRLLAMNQFALPMSQFLAAMSGQILDMEAANVMSVIGDAYSMERQKDMYITNMCPLLITQSPAIKSVLNNANVKVSWSEEKKTLDYTQPSYIATLTTNLDVEYSNPKDVVVDSCCVKTTFTQSMYRPDPLGTRVTRSAMTKNTPRVVISAINIMSDLYDSVRNKMYTLMMVDMSDPSNMIIHWMVSNIKDADVARGDHVLPYFGPNPFQSNDPRVYVFLLLKQNVKKLDTSNLPAFTSNTCPDFALNRCGAQLPRMLEEWDLQEIVGITWFQAVQDAYARKRLYSEWGIKTMIDVCDGQPGFEDPCPQEQYCGANSGQAMVTSLLTTIGCASFALTLVSYIFARLS